MIVGVVAGQARGHVVEGQLRKNRDAVIGFLPVNRDVVAEPFEFSTRECIVHAFDFL